jgi:hypothetical protein
MKKKRRIFDSREEFEAWLKQGEEVRAELQRLIDRIDAKRAARQKPAEE